MSGGERTQACAPDGVLEALCAVRERLWWFIEQDHGDGNEVDAAEVCAEAMSIQHDVIDPVLFAARASGRSLVGALPSAGKDGEQ